MKIEVQTGTSKEKEIRKKEITCFLDLMEKKLLMN